MFSLNFKKQTYFSRSFTTTKVHSRNTHRVHENCHVTVLKKRFLFQFLIFFSRWSLQIDKPEWQIFPVHSSFHKSQVISGSENLILMAHKQCNVDLRGTGLPLATQKSEAFWPSLTVISLDDSESRMSGGTEMEKRSSLFSEMFTMFEFTWSSHTYGWHLCSQSAFLMVSCWFGTCDKKGGLEKGWT